jgi:thiol-disulfide isomerase/thioredoxin
LSASRALLMFRGSPVVIGAEGIESLAIHLVRPQAPIPLTKNIGDLAPPIELEELGGESVRLEDFRGDKTLVIFWNPGCGFCQQMLPDLKEWEENPPKEHPTSW